MENKKERVMYLTPIIKVKNGKQNKFNNYNETRKIIESSISDVFSKNGITHAFMSGKPFYISGKNEDAKDTFILNQSEFYSINHIMESLLLTTKRKTEENFYSLVKSEHLPKSIFDKPDVEKDTYYITYPITVILSDNTESIFKSGFSLFLKEDIQDAIHNMFNELLESFISVKTIGLTPYTVSAQEAILKIIQAEDYSENGITRITMSQTLSISNPSFNKVIEKPLNLFYKDKNNITLPCHAYEDISFIMGAMEREAGIPVLIEENTSIYVNTWISNALNMNIVKNTLNDLGYETGIARSDFGYTIEGDFSNTYKDFYSPLNIEKELEKEYNYGYNVVKVETGDTSIDFIKENCKAMYIYYQEFQNNDVFYNHGNETITISVMVSYLSHKNNLICSENFYGHITNEVKENISSWLYNKSKKSELEIINANQLVNFNYDGIYNILLASK